MLKRINWKSVFKCFAWLFCLGGIVTLMSFVNIKKRTVNCTNIKIMIPGADNFIEREEIDAILKQNEGQLIGRKLEGINLHGIEDKIKTNPYIAMATIYADMDGVIHIDISQRQPLMRIINVTGQDFYIDRNGLKMPVSPNFTANVLVANGKIPEHFNGKVDTLTTKMAADLYKTAKFLKKDSLWDAQIEQLFVNDKDDIELIPRVGNQRIILGNADSLEVKMGNLRIFYKQAMPQVGWDTYKTINIKYTNQVICERSKPDSLHHTSVAGHAAFKPTVATEKKVMDSIVKAEIASELKNNPQEDTEIETVPENKTSSPVVKPVHKDVVVPVHKPEIKVVHKPDVKIVHQPEIKTVHKPEVKATHLPEVKLVHQPAAKPAHQPEAKKEVNKPVVKPWHKPAEKKTAAVEEKKEIPEKKKRPLEKRSALGDEVPVKKPENKAPLNKPENKAPVNKPGVKATVKKPEIKTTEKKTDVKTTAKKTESKTPGKKTTKFPEIRWLKPEPKKVVKPKAVKPKAAQPKMVNLHDDN
ncbi:cell division protein FtsQ/DivIB [Pedobacter sp. L105]|uniref:cell division protein FtsQ/DivIB n=1 Tax=Pedobacter sp. L105 TaxID=1641871 RepID=UPI0020B132BF|nr:cell division protein FtsQ [Pedobacter sp. L105]